MPDYDDFVLPVRFMPKDGTLDSALALAAQLDIETGLGSDEDEQAKTLPQAITVILHNAPERLHEFLAGWSVETPWEKLGEL